MMFSRILLFQILFVTLLSVTPVSVSNTLAQTVDELKEKITERNEGIKRLEAEIQQYQVQLETIGKEADTLKNALSELDLSRKKLEANIKLTESKIEATNLDIRELSNQIEDKSERIGDGRRVIAQSLSAIAQTDDISILETLFGAQSLSQVFHSAEQLNSLQASVGNRMNELRSIRVSLEGNKQKTEKKKDELTILRKDLENQKKVLAEAVREKNNLLAATKNTESDYKRVLAAKVTQKETFEKELFAYESALKVAIDRSLIPNARGGLLMWPLKNVRITQQFGRTVDAQRLYASGTHGGMDFAASIGTPIMASLTGTVTAAETYHKTGCQYGKFVLIKHPNGISTLYGHLSVVNVDVGDDVTTGQIIGYSGSTGYATGPHLHFGVYATQGVRIVDARDLGSRNCSGVRTVAAPPSAYLDPMIYL